MMKVVAAAALTLATGLACAQATPVGLWKTIDDETKQEKSLCAHHRSRWRAQGRIEKFLDPRPRQDSVCEKCADDRARTSRCRHDDHPQRQARRQQGQHWEGGDILDPNNGKVYKLRLKPLDSGKKLEVRGYIGPFYRNQQWIRVE
jgi:uncharacterized protein (DUF2147 family)